jgi:hypothetical protein
VLCIASKLNHPLELREINEFMAAISEFAFSYRLSDFSEEGNNTLNKTNYIIFEPGFMITSSTANSVVKLAGASELGG